LSGSIADAEIFSANCEFHQRSTVDYWGTVSNGFDEYFRLDIDTSKLTAKMNITSGDDESDDWANGQQWTWKSGKKATDFVVASETMIWFGRDVFAPFIDDPAYQHWTEKWRLDLESGILSGGEKERTYQCQKAQNVFK